MIACINIANKIIDIGLFENDNLIFETCLETTNIGTKIELAVKLKSIFDLYNISTNVIKDSIIASVVPRLTPVFCEAVFILINKMPLLVGPGIKTGLNIMIDNPSELGADIVCASVMGLSLYSTPILLINFGTATTFSVIDQNARLIGVLIYPGVSLSIESLYNNSALLPQITIKKPKNLLGSNSIESMESGLFYGTITMVEGVIGKIQNEFADNELNIIIAGSIGENFIDSINQKIFYQKHLVLNGLNLLYNKNSKNG